jgi:GTPase SAR1 family protein
MFSLFNGIYDSYLAPSQLNILVVGGTNSGKSALLERLKVTEIPTRTKGNDNTAQTAKEMTQTLYTAFVETGAVDIAGRRKSSIVRITDSDTKTKCTPEDINRQLAVAEEAYSSQTKIPPSQPVATAPSKRRFRFNICPAPERYLKSAQDQDEEFEAAEHEEEQKKLLASVDRERSRSPLSLEEEDNAAFSEPPRRVRCHSKEFNVESLDLMDGRTSSLQDIPLSGSLGKCGVPGANSNDPQKRSSRRSTTQMQPAIQGSALLQSSTAEYNVKANAKMLPLVKIRPTSKKTTFLS